MKAVFCVNAQLANDFKIIFAPFFNVHQSIMQWCTILALKVLPFAQKFGSSKSIGINDILAYS